MLSPSFPSPLALIAVFRLLWRRVVDLDARFRLQRAQRLIASDHNFIALLQALGHLNVGDSAYPRLDRTEDGLLAVNHKYALNFVLLGISRRRRRWRGKGHTGIFLRVLHRF